MSVTRWFIVACLCFLFVAAEGEGQPSRSADGGPRASGTRHGSTAQLDQGRYRPSSRSAPSGKHSAEGPQGSSKAASPRTPGRVRTHRPARTSVLGTISDGSGRSLVDAHLAVVTEDGRWEARSARDGAFRVNGVLPGPAVIAASKRGFEGLTRPLAVLAAGPTEIHLRMERSKAVVARVRGRVRSPSGTPLRATATVYPLHKRSTTDSGGDFEIALEPGHYTVRLRSFGYRSQSHRVDIEQGQSVGLDVVLHPK